MGPDKPNSIENHRFDDHRGYPDKKGVDGVLEPMNGFVLVEPDFGPTETKTGILLGNKRKTDIPKMGWIVALDKKITDLEVGDYVVFDSYQAKGFWNRGVATIPVKEEEVKAIVGDYKR